MVALPYQEGLGNPAKKKTCDVENPTNNRINYLLSGAGFLPQTASLNFEILIFQVHSYSKFYDPCL